MESPRKSAAGLLRAGDIAAVCIAPHPAWRDLILEVWDCGAAVLPIDSRLSPMERGRLLERARPKAIFDGSWWPVEGARPVTAGTALVMASSGTLGTPKLAALSHDAVRFAIDASAKRLNAQPEDPWLSCLRPAHIGGLLVVLRSVLMGTPLEILGRFDVEQVKRADAVFTSLVPTMLARLLDADATLSKYKAILMGGAATHRNLAHRAREARAPIVRTYGMTEVCGGVVYEGVPLDGIEMRLGDADQILLRGPTLMSGYIDHEDEDEDEQPIDKDGWMHTGDAGVLDGAGHLVRVERLDDVIVSGGEKVHPGEVEEILREHPGIADAAVAGRADPTWGHRVVAFIVPRDEDEPPALEEIRNYCGERIARYKAPREIRIVTSVPRTAGGKIRRHLLQGHT